MTEGVFTVTCKGGPLNDHEPEALTERTFTGDELPDALVSIPGQDGAGHLVEPPMEPPPGLKLYRRSGTIYVWG